MKVILQAFFLLLTLATSTYSYSALNVGIGKTEITPPIGTPSAGYVDRKGEPMLDIHDPLYAIALFIDNGEKKIVLCSVDHLGYTYEMVQEITKQVHRIPELKDCEIYIGSSHTHAGGGAYLNIPVIGEGLAGIYDDKVTKSYIKKTIKAITQAAGHPVPAKLGIGYGEAGELSKYRGLWPQGVSPLPNVAIIKVTTLDETPLAVLFNYPVHPTVLTHQNRLFSSDFVGYARDSVQSLLGAEVQPIYFNGAQGDIIPVIFNEEDRFDSCRLLGESLAETVKKIWDETETQNTLHVKTQKEPYFLKPQTTPFGLILPVGDYKTEMNVVVLNHSHAFLTIPGELSCLYDKRLKESAARLGYSHLSIFGLTNDAHGYIILPESWKNKTFESSLSFGGEDYGEITATRAETLLQANSPSH